jgi:DeoR/GlpR family transcriptional regulator of sugar metabolism
MLKDQRLNEIEKYINIHKYAPLADLVETFKVSEATMRRDLKKIENEERITITRGGASSVNRGTQYELPYMGKRKINYTEKGRIAKAACKYITAGATIFIDAGTTSIQMIEYLPAIQGLNVTTNDLMIASSMVAYPDISLNMIGGSIRKGYYNSYGYLATENLRGYHFDKAFLCLDAIGLEYGCMLANTEEVDIKQTLVKASKEIIVICDHTKFETISFISFCPLSDIDLIITGEELNKDTYRRFLDNGINIELV